MKNSHSYKLLSQLHWPWLLVTLLVFCGLIKLALWQNARADEKILRLTRISELNQQQAISLPQISKLHAQPQQDVNDLPVLLDGDFVEPAIFLLDNQPNNSRLGYVVYQIFKVQQLQVLVNLGWVQGSVNRQELPQLRLLTGHHKLKGNIRKLEKGIMLMEQTLVKNQWPLRVQQIEIDKFSQLISQPLLPFVVYLDTKESLGYKKNWVPIVMPPEKHRAYAFQWLSLAIAWLALMIWAAISAYKNNSLQTSKQ